MLRVTEAIELAGLSDTTWLTPEAAARGTAVHAAIALDIADNLDESSVHPVVAPYIESWRRYRRESGIVVIESELEVRHETMGYAGRLDLIGQLPGFALPSILDFKTGGRADWHPIQSAGYALARQAMVGGATPLRGALYLKDDGAAAVYVQHPHRNDFDVFRSAVVIAHWKQRGKA